MPILDLSSDEHTHVLSENALMEFTINTGYSIQLYLPYDKLMLLASLLSEAKGADRSYSDEPKYYAKSPIKLDVNFADTTYLKNLQEAQFINMPYKQFMERKDS